MVGSQFEIRRPLPFSIAGGVPMSLIRPSFLDRVVVLGIPDSSGKNSIQFVATGFLYGHFAGLGESGKPEYCPYLVTNRHVVEGPRELLVRLNGHKAPVLWRPDFWSTHPDPEVDVAVPPFHLAEGGVCGSWFLSDRHVYFREELKKVGFMEGDEGSGSGNLNRGISGIAA